jgi:signal peptidase I
MSIEMKAKADTSYGWGETAKIVVQALAIAMVVRVFFYQPFNIPSGSMKDTLLVGDFLFVSKLSYGYSKYSFPRHVTLCLPFTDMCGTFRILPDLISGGRVLSSEPERGDVVVFKLPRDNSTDYIKRVIGLPGDRIQVKNGVLHINGTAVPKRKEGVVVISCFDGTRPRPVDWFVETLPNGVTHRTLDCQSNGSFDNTAEFTVPEGHYFMMGDNRDNSIDSREAKERGGVGFVPAENLIGRAEIIFFSCASDEPGRCSWFQPWMWPFDIRWSRIFGLVR